MFQISTGVRNGLLIGSNFSTMMSGGLLKIYGAGSVPATADAALGAVTLLCTISSNGAGTGLNFEAAPVNGVLSKLATQIWKGVNAASGTPVFYRFAAIADDGLLSTTAFRVQGTVGILNEDLILALASLTIGVEQPIHYYSVGMPASA